MSIVFINIATTPVMTQSHNHLVCKRIISHLAKLGST